MVGGGHKYSAIQGDNLYCFRYTCANNIMALKKQCIWITHDVSPVHLSPGTGAQFQARFTFSSAQVLQAGFAINTYVIVLRLVELMTLHFLHILTLCMQVQL